MRISDVHVINWTSLSEIRRAALVMVYNDQLAGLHAENNAMRPVLSQ